MPEVDTPISRLEPSQWRRALFSKLARTTQSYLDGADSQNPEETVKHDEIVQSLKEYNGDIFDRLVSRGVVRLEIVAKWSELSPTGCTEQLLDYLNTFYQRRELLKAFAVALEECPNVHWVLASHPEAQKPDPWPVPFLDESQTRLLERFQNLLQNELERLVSHTICSRKENGPTEYMVARHPHQCTRART